MARESATTRGLAVLLSVSDALNQNSLATVGDVIFVGEEEFGNLRGAHALFRDQTDIDGFVPVDGIDVSRLLNRGTGSHRCEITLRAPGGHSFTQFGLPSAVHALGSASTCAPRTSARCSGKRSRSSGS